VTSAPLLDVDDVRSRVDARLTRHLDALAAELTHLGADDVLDELRRMVAGGKRLRAAFCYWSWRAHAADADPVTAEAAIGIGAALELFQAAALVHDDVMDDSDTRRGRPAAHRRFADQHAAEAWAGPSASFGEAVAILLGDLALIECDRAFAAAVAGLEPGRRIPARGVFDRMRTEVIAGQYLDVLAQAAPWGDDPASDEARARTVVRAKSARYSVEHPLVLGAVLAGADDAAIAGLSAAGLAIGEAFQLRDDLLGVFGNPATTGKPAGDDLREGKRTVLVARALARADDADRAALLDGLGRRDLADDDVHRLREVLRRTGAVAEVEALIDELAGPALDWLAAAPLAEPGREMLVRLGRAAVDRHA
jgi:geranylgeranyl diphosphate synthase type I